jgi:thioredoxin-related protein
MLRDILSENVAFVSLSIDEDKNAWRSEASFKKNKKVLQLWALNADTYLRNEYAINTIPRFILIDNKGNIVNASLPPPSDPEFEISSSKRNSIFKQSLLLRWSSYLINF